MLGMLSQILGQILASFLLVTIVADGWSALLRDMDPDIDDDFPPL